MAADVPRTTQHTGEDTMQIAQENAATATAVGAALPESSPAGRSPYSEYKLIRRNGAVVAFEPA